METDMLRIWRSPHTRFGGHGTLAPETVRDDAEDETLTAEKAYSDSELAGIAESGFNAIWVHGLLRNITCQEIFPELGARAELHVKKMKRLIHRANKYGLKVYIYMQPPRGIDDRNRFWRYHPEAAGSTNHTGGGGEQAVIRSLCTSTRKVKDYLRTAASDLARALPDLGGIILITASEHPSHCWARGGWVADQYGRYSRVDIDCPRCKERNPTDIVVEIIQSVHDGVRNISDEWDIIAWNWSWVNYTPDPGHDIINRLPPDVIMMADFERGGSKKILGRARPVDEYSLSYPGPSPRFRKAVKSARECGLKVMAKLQLGTTHELTTVPNLPLLTSIQRKAQFLRENKLDGFMGCWNFGNMRTANAVAFNRFLTNESAAPPRVQLVEFASEYFPGCDAEQAVSAWEQFALAMESYPFATSFLYSSPLNYALAYPIQPGPIGSRPVGGSWVKESNRGDCLEASLNDFSLDEVIEGLGRLQGEWYEGVKLLGKALFNVSGEQKKEELSSAGCCFHVFRSGRNIYRAYRLRKQWSPQNFAPFQDIVCDELANLEAVLPLVENDSRLGFHGEAFDYMFDTKSIKKKINDLKCLLDSQTEPNRNGGKSSVNP